jgi:uncharacterized damage-inducible protein DinB
MSTSPAGLTRIIPKPRQGDYPTYADMYLGLLPDDGLVLRHLWDGFLATKALIAPLPPARLTHRYALGKWSIKDVLVHVIDDERIHAYRALRYARNEQLGLVGFDQDDYARHALADHRSLDSIFDEYEAVRRATIALFDGLPASGLDRMGRGTGSAHGATPRAIAYHIAGHERHHQNVIKTRYLAPRTGEG